MREIYSDEFSEWIAYYRLEPFGEIINDARQARGDMLLANMNRGKNQRTYKVGDFMPKYGSKPSKPKQSINSMRQVMSSYARAHNAANKSERK